MMRAPTVPFLLRLAFGVFATSGFGGAAAAPAASSETTTELKADVAARGGVTRFHFESMPVRSALQLLAEEGGINLVVSDSVQGTVTLHLDGVTWEQALDVVLRLEGLRQHGEGSNRTVTRD